MASRFFLKSALNKLNPNDETSLEQIIVDSTTAASKAIENTGDKIDTRQVEEALKNALMNEVQKEIKDNATLNAIHDAVMSDKPLEDKILGASQKLLSEKQSKVVGGIMDQLRFVKELEAQQKAEFEAEQRAQADRQKQAAAELFESEMATRSRSASQSESAAGGEKGIGSLDGKPRDRKIDRKNLHADLAQELPISIRYNYNGVNDADKPMNYEGDWIKWENQCRDGCRIEILKTKIIDQTHYYDKLGNFNGRFSKGVQFSLLLLGSSIVYVQASGADMTLIRDWNIVGGGLTTFLTTIYNYWQFGKKSMHFAKVVTSLKLLKGWIESKLVLPYDQRYSPYDIYMIASKAYEAIIQDAEEGARQSTSAA